ncbi:hypothetical protein KCP74_11660 [Salmonella enterica subsp. enterica]|nr:hypothetical protein KCP74_11660 [Salmonella enterica subsp. enterica]
MVTSLLINAGTAIAFSHSAARRRWRHRCGVGFPVRHVCTVASTRWCGKWPSAFDIVLLVVRCFDFRQITAPVRCGLFCRTDGERQFSPLPVRGALRRLLRRQLKSACVWPDFFGSAISQPRL